MYYALDVLLPSAELAHFLSKRYEVSNRCYVHLYLFTSLAVTDGSGQIHSEALLNPFLRRCCLIVSSILQVRELFISPTNQKYINFEKHTFTPDIPRTDRANFSSYILNLCLCLCYHSTITFLLSPF